MLPALTLGQHAPPLPVDIARCRRALARCGLGALRRNQAHIYFSLLFVYLAFMVYEVNYPYFVLSEFDNGDTRCIPRLVTSASSRGLPSARRSLDWTSRVARYVD